jgi:hypothetical protein
MAKQTLIFIYNADSGLVNTLLDIGHKIVSPQTYSCNLCAITHSTFKMREEWKQFIVQLGCPVEFLHRDELARHHGIRDTLLPAIFCLTEAGVQEWIGQEAINRCRTLDELKHLIQEKLELSGGMK